MKCKELQEIWTAYLDGECSPTEERNVRLHLAGCLACRQEMEKLEIARATMGRALQGLAANAEPSPQAWNRLEARLEKAAQPSPSKLSVWLARLAPGGRAMPTLPKQGVLPMSKKIVLPALAAMAVLAIAVIFMTQTATPVLAQQVLDRAYQALSTPQPDQGILHTKVETYANYQALTPDGGTRTFLESYRDLQTGNYRTVVTDASGKVLEVSGYDGANTYSGLPAEGAGSGPLTIYRSPQERSKLVDIQPGSQDKEASIANAKQMFDSILKNVDKAQVSEETWSDGRKAYVIRCLMAAKVATEKLADRPMGTAQMAFDANTYQTLDFSMTIQKDGSIIVVNSQKQLANEILPAGSKVDWSFGDLQGVTIVDDPNREMGDLLPEKITREELLAKAKQVYLLQTVPAGFELTLVAPPRQEHETSYVYIAAYRNAAGEYLVIQSGNAPADFKGEVITTASGLKISLADSTRAADGKTYTTASFQAPDGTSFALSSSLPIEQFKTLVEGLVPVQ